MTQRERQILQLIEANPLISQQQIADKLGITRSSAAVHISNLMKKGCIAGKGYVLRSGSKSRPLVIDRKKHPLTEEDGVIYSGCFCNVSLAAAGFDAQVKKGVTVYLNGVQFFRDGERLAGYDAMNDFEELDDENGGESDDDII